MDRFRLRFMGAGTIRFLHVEFEYSLLSEIIYTYDYQF
jgi:hypothetical protein